MRIVDQMPGFYALGIVVAICNAQSKRLGDFVAGSIVVRETSLSENAPSWIAPSPSPPIHSLAGQRLTSEEIHLINAFLIRRSQLSPEVRRSMADDILTRLSPKLGLTNEDRYRREATLESLAHEHRAT